VSCNILTFDVLHAIELLVLYRYYDSVFFFIVYTLMQVKVIIAVIFLLIVINHGFDINSGRLHIVC